MAKKITEKYNDACVKLFEFIKMLYEDEAEFRKVIDLISDGKYDGTSNTHVTLNKYLNALKIFGINVKKINNKYKILTPLYKMQFCEEDLKCISKIKNVKDNLPEGNQKKQLQKFLRNLEIRFDENTKKLSKDINVCNNNPTLNLLNENFKLCEKFCQEQHKLEIIYTDSQNNEINLLCTPSETSIYRKKVTLKVIGNNGSRIYDIPFENIKFIKQLPSSTNSTILLTTIVYRIKNRLAKNYRLREWEKLENKETNGNLVIVNKGEDFNILLKRLMRYGAECEIISPKFFKEEMKNLINKTLSNYI